MFSKIIFVLLILVAGMGRAFAQSLPNQDSPFGIQAPYCIQPFCKPPAGYSNPEITGYLIDVGIKQVRLLKPELSEVSEELSVSGIGILSGIVPTSPLPENQDSLDDFKKEIRETVSAYKGKVKAWNVGNEPDGANSQLYGHPEKYAELLRTVHNEIKTECDDCIVVIGGIANGHAQSETEQGPRYLDGILENGGGDYFDVLDIHFQGVKGYYKNLERSLAVFRGILNNHGYEKPVWISEYGTHDGDPDGLMWGPQTEIDQASELLKRYVYGLVLGVDKMFWTTMLEWSEYGPPGNDYFENVGLINNPKNDGQSHKKLAYYTYKKMVEVLEGSDWGNIEAIQEKDGIYIYKFIKNGKPIRVAWNDSSAERQIPISGINSNQVIPAFDSDRAHFVKKVQLA